MPGRWTLLNSYWQTRRRRFSSREALLAWQDRQVRRFLKKILPRSPFYARHFQGLPLARWQEFPPINKALMMEHFDQLNTVGLTKDRAFSLALEAERSRDFEPTWRGITVGLSSGTSGARGLFLVSPQERHAWAGAVLAKALPASLLEKQRIALFLRANSNLYQSVQSRWVAFEFFDLAHPLEEHLARLARLDPTLVVAPPSLLRCLAQASERGQLRIAPRKLISVAEVLDPLDEAFIQARFGQPVHQIYQATEGFLGCTCSQGTLHLNEDLVAIQKEWLDERTGKFVPIVTDFHRLTQPIIRYRLDDILTERGTPCPCGSVLTALEGIEGRCDDLFYLKPRDGDGWLPVFPDFIRGAILTCTHVQTYQARQLMADEVEIALQVSNGRWEEATVLIAQQLQALWDRSRCLPPRVRFVPLAQEAPGPQKRKRVSRCFPAPSGDKAPP